MTGWSILNYTLTVTIFLPIVGVLFILMIPQRDEGNARWTALWTTLATFGVSLILWFEFDNKSAEFQFVEKYAWIPAFDINYYVGVDGISMLFVILSTFLTLLAVIASWEAIRSRVKEYLIAFLLLETMMVGMFAALDLVLFYIFFEGVLIPMFLIIGVWGGGNRVYAAFKFFLYTLTGSVLMLIALLVIYFETDTTAIPDLLTHAFAPGLQLWLWLAFFASFAVKIPMWPVHTWLPDAHVEAPTAGSVILAGVLLKMGAYGFLRFSVPMLPYASEFYTPLVYTLSVIAIVYTSLVALAQEDMKKLIAYSSVAHMGFVTIGIFTLTHQGVQGAIAQMLSHGFISAALFLCVGVVYDRLHTRDIGRYGGLVHRMPAYAAVFMVFTLGSVGLPGTSGFIGEILVLVGAFRVNTWVAALAATGVILGAAYMLFLYRRVIFGALTKDELKSMADLSPREIAVFAPLVLVTLWMGIYPAPFLEVMDASIVKLIDQHKAAMSAIGKVAIVAR
jgi:NADH-quinone oxidoreductase subunit M